MRRPPRSIAAGALLTLLTAPGWTAPTLRDSLREDAALHAVAAFNAGRAWAVGDRGVALRTVDGGQTWTHGATPTDASLRGVCFLDDRRGWAVGGSIRPHTHESRGVVLRTIDGGAQWESIAVDPIPRLRAIRMFDAERGVAAGDGGPLAPSGVFTTDNGGRNWRPVPCTQRGRWRAAALSRDDDRNALGVLVGPSGFGRLAERRVTVPKGGRSAQGVAVAFADDGRTWLVGDHATIRSSVNGGSSWTDASLPAHAELRRWFRWRAIATSDERLTVVGSPGSIALRSSDGGDSWSAAPTGVTTPLNAVAMAPDGRAWAVGDYGVVAATVDGGETWRVQRGERRHAAALLCVATPEQTPCEWLAVAGSAEGARTALLAPFDLGPETNDRLAAAAIDLSASAADRHGPVPLPAGWRASNDQALRRLLAGDVTDAVSREIARSIIAHRPEAVVLPAVEGPHPGAAAVLRDAARAGVELAANASTGLGLSPWRTRRLIEVRPLATDQATPPAARRLTTGRFVTGLGGSPVQSTQRARGLIARDAGTPPDGYAWAAIDGAPLRGGRTGAPLDDLGLRRGGGARRPPTATPHEGVERLRRIAQKQRQLRAMLARDGGDPSVWSGQAIELTGGLDAASGAALLAELANGYRRAGHHERAAETLYLLARRYPDEPLADASILRLIRHYASGERAHAATRLVEKRSARPAPTDDGIALAAYEPVNPPDEPSGPDRLERATRLVEFLEQARPPLFADASTRSQAAAIDRRAGRASAAERAMLVQSAAWIDGPWRRAASAERWLADRSTQPPEKPIATCRRTERRPLLDAELNEPCWADADPVTLAGNGDTTVRLLRDNEFLYVAVEAAANPEPVGDGEQPRPRDADLTGQDRVRLRIDTDRDYATAWELTIDRRGWTHDALAGDPLWNPAWYVAADADDAGWRIEAAIPLEELCDPSAAKGATWAVAIDRTRAGNGPSAWGDPRNDPDSPDAFGLLMVD